ncbi:MAG: SemiSWEET family transporter [Candidatus Auribacterota bacterium]
MIWTIIGLLAAILTMFGFVPQIIKMICTKHVKDVSLGTIIQFTIGVSLWTLYGLHLRDWIIVAANAVNLSTQIIALSLYTHYLRRDKMISLEKVSDKL